MFDHKHYVPILKGKAGEYSALTHLADPHRDHLTPLIEVPSIPWDFQNDEPAKTIDQHLAKLPSNLLKAWGRDRRIFVDMSLVSEELMTDGRHPITFVFDELRANSVTAIPVIGLDSTNTALAATLATASTDGIGLCLRLVPNDFTNLASLGNFLAAVHHGPDQIDLILDFESVSMDGSGSTIIAASSVIGALSHLTNWRSLTFVASGFPQSLTGMPANSISTVPRAEWTIWQSLIARTLARKPTFGDYAISHPEISEIDPRLMTMSAAVRYTTTNSWLVLRGRGVNKHGYGQFRAICQHLITRSEYSGAAFSWGDQSIQDCASGTGGTGNMTTWRAIGTSHHLAFVVDQLANFVWP